MVRSIGDKIEFMSKMAEQLLLMHGARLLNDEELLLFADANRKRNPHGMLCYRNYDRFVLENLDESQCFVEFRFKKEDIYHLAVALRLREVFRCKKGVVVDSVELYASVSSVYLILVSMQTLYLGLVGLYHNCV